jgi:uncharacterized membrane protein YgcG
MTAWNSFSNPKVADVVASATRWFGRKAGYAMAAQALGIAERTARGIAYREASGANIPAERIEDALHTLRRARAAQLRAELAALEEPLHAILESSRAPVRVAG